jgi:hypothetical protein
LVPFLESSVQACQCHRCPETSHSRVSPASCTDEHVFEPLGIVDPDADESALVERIAELECLKSAAAAAQARRDSPNRGGRHLGFAWALVHEMPHTLAALEAGALSEWRATLIVRESACLDVDDRRTLDAELCADLADLDGLGDARSSAGTRQHGLCERAAADDQGRRGLCNVAPGRRHLR